MFVREVFHVTEVKHDFGRYCHLVELSLGAGTYLSLRINIGLLNHITVWVSSCSIISSHIDKAILVNLIAIQFKFYIDRAAKVLPETRTEAWN